MERKKVKNKLKEMGGRLVAITCLQENGFTLVYHVDKGGKIMSLPVSSKKLFESVIDVFPTAEIYEREAHDLFGVEFDNPESRKVFLLPDGWKGKRPMRK